LTNLDIRDIELIDTLVRTNNISVTAELLGLSQPSVSIRIAKLRKHFADPLFVRTSEGMQPTPKITSLLPAIHAVINLFSEIEEGDVKFDPKTSSRVFRIGMTNTGQIVVIAKLKNALNMLAPNIRLEVVELTANSPMQLERGEIDIVMGFTKIMGPGFYQQKLFSEHYVCLVRSNHPRIKNSLSIEQFIKEDHVSVKSSGTAHWLLEKAIDDAGVTRKIALWVPSFLGLAEIVRTTDLLALAPIHLARILCRDKSVRSLDIPIQIPSYDVKQYWHERYHQESGNIWLRKIIANTMQNE
jgi:DNA-binding transcriptional LysR family regulator